MKLTVFGATGPMGLLLVDSALAGGHDVRVYARSPGKLPIRYGCLEVAKGQLDNPAAIEAAVAGADAVLSLLGPPPRARATPLTSGMHNIVSAMKRHGVRRLVAVSTPSARDPADGRSLKLALMIAMVRRLAGSAYQDIVGMADVVRGSGLDWTLVRVQLLTNGPHSGRIRAGYVGDGCVRTLISRANTVDFMLAQLADARHVGKAPLISNG